MSETTREYKSARYATPPSDTVLDLEQRSGWNIDRIATMADQSVVITYCRVVAQPDPEVIVPEREMGFTMSPAEMDDIDLDELDLERIATMEPEGGGPRVVAPWFTNLQRMIAERHGGPTPELDHIIALPPVPEEP